MKKFTFNLERVLSYREQVEKEKQVALTKVQQLVADHESRLLEAYSVLETARGELRSQLGGGLLDVQRAKEQRRYIAILKERVSAVLKRLRKLEILLNQRRDEAVQARKERKVLEMLKGRRRRAYMKELDRAEVVELDDLVGKKEAAKRMGVVEDVS